MTHKSWRQEKGGSLWHDKFIDTEIIGGRQELSWRQEFGKISFLTGKSLVVVLFVLSHEKSQKILCHKFCPTNVTKSSLTGSLLNLSHEQEVFLNRKTRGLSESASLKSKCPRNPA